MGTAVAIDPEPAPLVRDQAGRLMVPGTRVSLDVLMAAFKRGDSPEVIHENYKTVSLADVNAIFAYYLRHRGEVEDFLEVLVLRVEQSHFDGPGNERPGKEGQGAAVFLQRPDQGAEWSAGGEEFLDCHVSRLSGPLAPRRLLGDVRGYSQVT